jgi:hypothetical protein
LQETVLSCDVVRRIWRQTQGVVLFVSKPPIIRVFLL